MYKYIRSEGLLHLPHPNLIRRHIAHYQFRPGHQEEQFYLLEQKMQGMQDPRNCQVDMIFDEVHLEVFTTAGHISFHFSLQLLVLASLSLLDPVGSLVSAWWVVGGWVGL